MNGPKCDWNEAGKYCKGGKVAWAPFGHDKPYVTDEDCPVCHGTGEGELTADQAAEILTGILQTEIEFSRGPDSKTYFILDPKRIEGCPHKRRILGSGKTFAEAMSKAARAVRSKGCQK